MLRRTTALSLCALMLFAALAALSAPVGTVAAQSSSEAKAKVLYFQNATATIGGESQFLMNSSLPTTAEVVEQFTDAEPKFSWFIDPPLAGDLVLNGTVRAFLWVQYLNAKGDGTTFLTLGLGLYAHKDGTTTTILNEEDAANHDTHSFVTSHFSEYSVDADISAAVTVEAGSRLEIVLLLKSNATVEKRIAWGSDDFPSRLAVPAVTRIAMSQIRALNETGGEPAFFQSDDNITLNATVVDPFGGYDIVWVNLTLEAPDGTLLFDQEPMARTTGNDTSYASTFELNWPDTPKTNGVYNVTVEAVDRTGFHFRFPDRPGDDTFGGHLESVTVLLAVGEIIWVNFLLKDTKDRPLEEAELELWDSGVLAASGTSNATGAVNLTGVPGTGSYMARGYWQDVLVLEVTVNVPGVVNEDEAIPLTLGVYDPILRVVDDARQPLADATVFLSHPNGTTSDVPLTTDAQGDVTLTRTAGGSYTLRIIWSGVDVGVKAVAVASNDVHLVLSDVFYLTLRTRDQADQTVAGVHVAVTDVTRALIADSQLSDANGTLVSRLPKGLYRIEANWLGASVGGVDSLSLGANQSLDLQLSIFNVALTVVDQEGMPLERATMEVSFQGFNAGGTTGTDGTLSLQLPGGELALKVRWKDVLVFDGTRTVEAGSMSLSVSVQVYHAPVKVVDKDGNPLVGVSLTLYRDDVPVDGGITGADGIHTFRQPVGSYRVVADLETTHLLTGIDQTAEVTFSLPADGPVEVRFAEFAPPVTSTNLFYVLLVAAALAGALGFLLFRWKRGGGSPPPEPEFPGQP